MISKKILAIAIVVALFGAASCRKQFDINQNPNVAQEVTPGLLLPTAQLAIGSAIGVDMNNNGSIWVQHWTQNPSASQYRTLEQYQPTASTYDRVWGLLYNSALPDLKKMEELAEAENLNQYRAISKILRAYSFQLITDAWGDAPYREALRGLPEDGGILNPNYDPQSLIYDSIIQLTKEGMALIDVDDANHPGADDLIYGGHMDVWEVFGNTLLLRMYMRLSEVNPGKAQAGVAEVFANGIGFLEEGLDAQINYGTAGGNQNPLAVEDRRLGQNQVASATSADSMNSNADPRRSKFYTTAASGIVIGLPQGLDSAQPGVTYTVPNPVTGANASVVDGASGQAASAAPVKLLTSYESYFLQAEAAARGWAPGNAKTLFESGIEANFDAYGLTPAQATTYITTARWGIYPAAGTVQQQIRHIITQKWFSMNGNQGFEAWTEWRRTGYPDFLVQSATSILGPGRFPVRFFYPDAEFSRNANFPGQKLIYDRVYWDVN